MEEFPERLDFVNGKLQATARNVKLLSIDPKTRKNALTRAQVLEKLENYRLIKPFETKTNRWTRYINIKDGFLRAGGFVIRNEKSEDFLVFKNVSANFTFSVKRKDIILFERIPKDSVAVTAQVNVVIQQFQKTTGSMRVAVDNAIKTVIIAPNISKLASEANLNRGGLSRAFKAERNAYKNFLIFSLSKKDANALKKKILNIPEKDKRFKLIPDNVMEIINRFY